MKHIYCVIGDMSDFILPVRARSARKALKLARDSGKFRADDRLGTIEISPSGPSMVVVDFPVDKMTFEKPPTSRVREMTGQLLYRGSPIVLEADS